MPGNRERLKSIVQSAINLRLLFTLGNEAAAFVRGMNHAKEAQQYLYKPPEGKVLPVLGRDVCVVHLAHPGAYMRSGKWKRTHAAWCSQTGRRLVRQVMGTF